MEKISKSLSILIIFIYCGVITFFATKDAEKEDPLKKVNVPLILNEDILEEEEAKVALNKNNSYEM